MPSGAKKRKAAKKKKGNHPNPSSSTDPHGGDDVGVAVSQDHHSQHNLLTAEEIEKRGKDLNPPSVEGAKIDDKTAVSVGRDIKIADEEESSEKNGREHSETSRKSSYDGGSSGSSGSGSSSSSDDESHDVKNSQEVVHITPVADSVKVADTFSGEHIEAIEATYTEGGSSSTVENVTPVVPEKTEFVFNANGGKQQSSVEEGVPEASTEAVKQETEAIVPSVENVAQGNDDQLNVSCNVPAVEEKVDVPEASTGAVTQQTEAIVPSVENVAQENDDQLNVSSNVPAVAADNGRDAEKDSGLTEPLLPPVPHAEQTSSWKSCCGLFDLFTGSGR